MNRYQEPARDVPVVEQADVIVCGAGPAGIAAALAAARSGATVRLLETQGCLGGVWTAGLLGWILDAQNKTGLLAEVLGELEKRGARQPVAWTAIAVDVEAMKLLLEEMCQRCGVRVRLHTRVVGAVRDHRNRVTMILTESKSGREAWSAKVFVDATGDGDLAGQAGCGFEVGRSSSGQAQPMSMLALLAGVDESQIKPFIHDERVNPGWHSDIDQMLAAIRAGGYEPSYHSPVLFRIHHNLFALMANHVYRVSATDAQQVTDATMMARAEINKVVGALKKNGGPWRDLRLVATASHIGVREGRRVHGRFRVTTEEMIAGARFEDGICRVTFPVDLHEPDPGKGKSFSNEGIRSRPYDIPLRALIARDVDGLMMAGRCISGDFLAHSSYRVTGNAFAMGEAAGVAAALSAGSNVLPQEVPFAAVREGLTRLGRVWD